MVSPADWRLKTCLWLAAAITMLQLLLVLLGICGIYIPLINQVTGFIFVVFVPGLLLLRILRVHGIHPVEALAYTAGLSLACVMLCGALVNLALPALGVAHPITTLPLGLSLSILNAILILIAWLRERRLKPVEPAQKSSFDPVSASLLVLLLLLVILGVEVLDKTGSNAVLIIFILGAALCFGLGAFRRGLAETAYPAAIYIISLGLLYQSTLLSPYLTGSDIYFEYQFYQMVEQNGLWDCAVPGTINSCLSIVMGVPIFSQMLHVDGVWVLKAVYPLIFSLVPLTMYRFIRIQAGKPAAFLSVFFFMAVPVFSLELTSLGRQQFAELFFTLLVLLLTERKISGLTKAAMLIIFALGVSISHYTLGFINLVYLGVLVCLLFILRSKLFISVWSRLTARTGGLPLPLRYTGTDSLPLKLLLASFIAAFALSLAWYAVTASGSNLDFFTATLVMLLQKIGINMEGLLALRGNAAQYLFAGQGDVIISAALGLDFSQVSAAGKVFRILQYITQLLIVAGCIRLLVKPSGLNLGREYIAFSAVSAVMLAGCIILPWFSNILNITRWYHIALITLCPFLVIGARSLWELGALALARIRASTDRAAASGDYIYWLASVIILPYFIFTSGLVFELAGQSDINTIDTPYSFALSSNRLDLTGTFNRQDGAAARWLSQHRSDNCTVYTDVHARKIILFEDYPSHLHVSHFDRMGTEFATGYLFFTNWNVKKDELAFTNTGRPGMREHLGVGDIPGLEKTMQGNNRIYTNGGSEIWFIR